MFENKFKSKKETYKPIWVNYIVNQYTIRFIYDTTYEYWFIALIIIRNMTTVKKTILQIC